MDAPIGVPRAVSKRIAETFIIAPLPDVKYSTRPSADQRGLSADASPVVIMAHSEASPPSALTTASLAARLPGTEPAQTRSSGRPVTSTPD